MTRKSKEFCFEDSVAELETIVTELENGNPALKELMEKYQRGVELANKCMLELEMAEKTMDTIIREQNDEIKEEPLKV